jgi:hypothetical protein
MHNSVNDFIDSEFCSVRYANIDDAVKLVKRIGRNGKLAKADVKSAFRLLRVSPGDFDQLGGFIKGPAIRPILSSLSIFCLTKFGL